MYSMSQVQKPPSTSKCQEINVSTSYLHKRIVILFAYKMYLGFYRFHIGLEQVFDKILKVDLTRLFNDNTFRTLLDICIYNAILQTNITGLRTDIISYHFLPFTIIPDHNNSAP